MLDDLLELLFTKLVQELFIENRHLLLLHKLIQSIRLLRMRDSVQFFLFDALPLA